MAVTKIWAIHDSVSRVVDYCSNPEKTRLTDLEQECEKAVMQIDDRMYAKTLEDRYDQVSCFGIAFYKKRCLIQKK